MIDNDLSLTGSRPAESLILQFDWFPLCFDMRTTFGVIDDVIKSLTCLEIKIEFRFEHYAFYKPSFHSFVIK